MSTDVTSRWCLHSREQIKPMYRDTCEARITLALLRSGAYADKKITVYLTQPANNKRKSEAYQPLLYLWVPDYTSNERCRELATVYLRAAEIRFGLTITKIMFRSEEVKDV